MMLTSPTVLLELLPFCRGLLACLDGRHLTRFLFHSPLQQRCLRSTSQACRQQACTTSRRERAIWVDQNIDENERAGHRGEGWT